MEYLNRKGLHFEEFEVGWGIETPGRTVTEADIVAFAALSGDWTAIHVDREYAAGTPFGERIAHGLLVLSIASGLAVRQGFIEDTIMAFRSVEWKFSLPVKIGDTVHVRLEITEKQALPRLGGGQVIFNVEVLNQQGQTVQRGVWSMLVKSRPEV